MCKLLFPFLIALSLSVHAQTRYELPPGKQSVKWEGKNLAGSSHDGFLDLTLGFLTTGADGSIQNGEFTIDMTTLRNSDPKNDNLDEHLRTDDFFAVNRFPKATFTITRVGPGNNPLMPANYWVKGQLTIKEITNAITVPSTIKITPAGASIVAEIIFDRTAWGISYNAPGFFAALKDDMIAREIKVSIDLKLVKAAK